jgi:hypothetical protein
MLEYVKGFFPPPLSKPASALLDIHLKLFTLNQLRVFEQTLNRKADREIVLPNQSAVHDFFNLL